MQNTTDSAQALKAIESTLAEIKLRLSQVVVGQKEVIEELLVGILTGGHVLIEGAPGLAKTTLVSAMAIVTGLEHGRIQFTPDLMPSDVLGSEILEEDPSTGARSFRFQKGPIFTQILLADEINRTPPKTQAALLQAMQEKRVSIAGQTLELPFPFVVYATQNPIENEGTYPLPEAQLDRFMLKVLIDYPSESEERKIALINPRQLKKPEQAEPLLIVWQQWFDLLDAMPLAESLINSAVALARNSRPDSDKADSFIKENVRWGAGPRASQYLLLASRAFAALEGLAAPDFRHLKRAAFCVLRHRIIPSLNAEAGHIHVENIIEHLLKNVLSS